MVSDDEPLVFSKPYVSYDAFRIREEFQCGSGK